MLYRFNEFEFDSVSLLLTKNDEALPIRHAEAKILAAFLEQSDVVLTKEEILSYGWPNKVVSEQVVFQNISHLRSRFGSDAIKTFPKRGYQWQLNIDVISTETQCSSNPQDSENITEQLQQPSPSRSVQKRYFWQFTTLACVFFIAVGIFFTLSNFEQDNKGSAILDPRKKLAYIPMTSLAGKSSTKTETAILVDAIIEGNKDFDFTVLSHLNAKLFEDAMEIEYPKLSQTYPLILTGKIRSHKRQVYLDFMLKGPSSDWKGHLSGSSKEDVVEQMQQHLKQQVIYDLISHPQSAELRQAKLSIANQTSPKDLNILRKLSIVYLKNGELEKAMVMADKLINLAKSQNNSRHMGKALLYQSNLLRKKKLYDLSAQKLQLAIEQFEAIDDLKHQAHAWYIRSRLDHQQKNYPAIKTSLLRSAQLAYESNDKISEIDALTYLSELAHYYQKESDKYLYLQQAENKMNIYQLPIYHFARIPFHYAIFAKTLSEKEPHLKQVLKFTALTPEHWAAQSSRRQLMQHYIMQNRLIEAQALVESVSADNYNNSYLKTLMAQAEQRTDNMIHHAQRTFEQAHLAGDHARSLDVALLLCQQQVNSDFYAKYITDNATASWRNINEKNLATLSL